MASPVSAAAPAARAPAVAPAADVSPLAAFAARVEEDARRSTPVAPVAQSAAPVPSVAPVVAPLAAPIVTPVAAPITVEPLAEQPVIVPAPAVAAVVAAAAEPAREPGSKEPAKDDTSEDSAEGNKDKAELGAAPHAAAAESASGVKRAAASEQLWNAEMTPENERLLLGAQFDGKAWTNAFRSARRDNVEARVAYLRRLVQKGTNEALRTKSYEKDGHLVRLGDTTESVKRTTFYDGKSAFGSFSRLHQTTAHFVRADVVDVALFLMDKKNVNPVVLVLADEKTPGGSHELGTCAQEESIYRRTTLRLNLEDPDGVAKDREWKYEIAPFGGIYAPDVQVFRSSEGRGYEFLPQPKRVSFVLASSLARPELVAHKKKPGKFLNEDDAKTTKKKIETILNIGLQNGHDAIVLTAFGCGYNHNPPAHIAKLFREVITQQFPACYRHVTFAIIDDENTKLEHNPDGNIRPFQEEFLNVTSRAASKKCVVL